MFPFRFGALVCIGATNDPKAQPCARAQCLKRGCVLVWYNWVKVFYTKGSTFVIRSYTEALLGEVELHKQLESLP